MLKNLVAFIVIIIGLWLVREGIDMLSLTRSLYVSAVGVFFVLVGLARFLLVKFRRDSAKSVLNA